MTASLLIPPVARFFKDDSSGEPLSFGWVYTYAAGTDTPKDSYTTYAGNTANSNPVHLDANGEANIWLNGNYKINVEDADHVQIDNYPVDNVSSSTGGSSGTSYVLTTGIANVYIATPSSALVSYTTGISYYVQPNVTNSGPSTINFSGLGNKAITLQDGVALAAGDFNSSYIYEMIYDGTEFVIQGNMSFQSDGNVDITGGTLDDVTISNSTITDATMSDPAITGGTITGLDTPLPIASGGTNAATVAAARIALGILGIGAPSALTAYVSGAGNFTILSTNFIVFCGGGGGGGGAGDTNNGTAGGATTFSTLTGNGGTGGTRGGVAGLIVNTHGTASGGDINLSGLGGAEGGGGIDYQGGGNNSIGGAGGRGGLAVKVFTAQTVGGTLAYSIGAAGAGGSAGAVAGTAGQAGFVYIISF